MTTFNPREMPKVLELYLKITQYPILAKKIRQRMRRELFSKGIIAAEDFEREVRENARASQKREGLTDPLAQEPAEVWQRRVDFITDNMTDSYYAYNFPPEDFDALVQAVVMENAPGASDAFIPSFNPELAPWDVLFAKADEYEGYPPEKKKLVEPDLQQIIVVLTRGMISEQLGLVGLAKRHFTIHDLKEIRRRRIGRGKIGGKAAGMMLAWKIITTEDTAGSEDEMCLPGCVTIPESYFIGADMLYDFKSLNPDVGQYQNQKYKPPEVIAAEYPEIVDTYLRARFPDYVVGRLAEILKEVGNAPLIVRSSSLLEDNFNTSFAGKYDSYFCPNQGTLKKNLDALLEAIARVYACTLSPDALMYRRFMGLIDYDERMAILLQKVQGRRYGRYFFPTLAGVGFSQNPFRWSKKIRREEGFLRLVAGMGTRAVERLPNDYPRMIALSHPELRPERSANEIRKYSQRFVDLIDLEDNRFRTLHVSEVLSPDFPAITYIASIDKGEYIQPIYSRMVEVEPDSLVLTFDTLLRGTRFSRIMSAMLDKLERHYKYPVDVEFTVDVKHAYPQPEISICLLQCRPLARQKFAQAVRIPRNVPRQNVIFTSDKFVPQGKATRVRYVVYVDPIKYYEIPDNSIRLEFARIIGRLNKIIEDENEDYILMGPGRWGTSNIDLGVKVTYADIYHAWVLVEIAIRRGSGIPEVSYGTHFFQDLVESEIYPLPLYPDDPGTVFNFEFFESMPNSLGEVLPSAAEYEEYIRLIDLPACTGGRYLDVLMNGDNEEAIAYLRLYLDEKGEIKPGPEEEMDFEQIVY